MLSSTGTVRRILNRERIRLRSINEYWNWMYMPPRRMTRLMAFDESKGPLAGEVPQRNARKDVIHFVHSAAAHFREEVFRGIGDHLHPAVDARQVQVMPGDARQRRIDFTGQDPRLGAPGGQPQGKGAAAGAQLDDSARNRSPEPAQASCR